MEAGRERERTTVDGSLVTNHGALGAQCYFQSTTVGDLKSDGVDRLLVNRSVCSVRRKEVVGG